MFGTKNVSELTIPQILSKVSQYELFRYYCTPFTEINKKFSSELRPSDGLSCAITQMPSGWLIYKDFVTSQTYSCFTYVQEKYRCIQEEALKIIETDFKLGTKPSNHILPPSLNYVGLADKDIKKKKTNIYVKARNWTNKDIYWDQYEIDKELLGMYQVVPLSSIMLQQGDIIRPIYSYSTYDPAYSYEHGSGLRKILRPNTTKENKWISNLPREVYSGYNQLDQQGEILIITSSLKDVMIWRKTGINAIAPQGESIKPTKPFIELLKKRFPTIIMNYDNDKHGIRTMKEIEEEIGLPWFIVEHKDPSDYVKNEGFNKNKLLNFIKNAYN